MPKVLVVGFLVAASQLIGVMTSSYLAVTNSYELLAVWARTEAILALVTSVLYFGHQHSLNRELVRCGSPEKKVEYIRDTQQTMFNMSLIGGVFFICLASFHGNSFYLLLALTTLLIGIAPDFALYGLSRPVHAGFVSLLKVGGPSFVLLFLALRESVAIELLYAGVAFSYFIAAAFVLVATKAGVSALVFRVKTLTGYVSVYKLGFPSLLLTGLRSIPIIVAATIFSAAELVPLVLFYKYSLLFFGVKRLFVQTYYRDLINAAGALRLDIVCFSMASVGWFILFTLKLDIVPLIGLGEHLWIYDLCLVIALFSFLGVSNGTRIILLNGDRYYFFIHVVAMIVLITGVVLGFINSSISYFVFAGIGAEMALALGALFGRLYFEIFD